VTSEITSAFVYYYIYFFCRGINSAVVIGIIFNNVYQIRIDFYCRYFFNSPQQRNQNIPAPAGTYYQSVILPVGFNKLKREISGKRSQFGYFFVRFINITVKSVHRRPCRTVYVNVHMVRYLIIFNQIGPAESAPPCIGNLKEFFIFNRYQNQNYNQCCTGAGNQPYFLFRMAE